MTYTLASLFITEGKQGGDLEAGGDTEAEFTGCRFLGAPHGLLSLLIEPVTTNPGVVLPTIDRALQHHKMVYRLMYNLIFWRHFLNGGSLISDDYSSDVKLV